MLKFKTAFVTFFPVIPDNMGSSAVVNSRFKNWPYVKKLFQISHVKKINNHKIKTIFIKKENPINKIIKLPELIFKIFQFLKKSKNNLIIIEGASWIFYSFIVLFSFKILLPNSKIIYVSHSIESEIRKKYSNVLIYYLTKFLERLVFKYSFISTSVSKLEKNKIKKLYNHETVLYSNAITIENQNKKREIQQDYIIYCGSYKYRPNKNAIDCLNNKIMPSLLKKIPNLKLVLTGGGFNKNLPWIINKEIVPKKDLYNLIFYSKCMCVPLKFGSGTRIKIIEALSLGAIVISTKKGIEGIELINTNPPFVVNDTNLFLSTIYKVIRNNKNLKIKSLNDKMFYFKKYSMKNITLNFINNYLKNIS
ncbi:glycosyltransferase [Candidatus Pelagibacter sp. Uisw_127]|uniref:glycosyltransferase n=1 Tax=Candidatus Pelagibacter sp. Uisw_127 TaxID=3230988 RepID=UPI0039EBC30E